MDLEDSGIDCIYDRVGAAVCIPCHVLCPGMLPGPDRVSDEHTVAGPEMTE